ncbi:MAG: phosphatidate cytidylyltransferase [Muribaculaceae bacterium]|nr:phosphatidate cytidylyltransferase [Muribaculaceae bacterium]
MLKRAIFGALYVAIIIIGILCGPLVFLLLLLTLSTLGVNEFLNMTGDPAAGRGPSEATVAMLLRSLDCVGAAVLVVTVWVNSLFLPGIVTYILYLLMRLTIQLWVRNADALRSLSTSMMSQLYVALPIALMSIVYRLSPHLVLLLFILVWVNDTFAYLTGRRFGRRKLWERISPKKTFEGLWGGMAMTVIVAVVCGIFFSRYFAGMGVLAMGILGIVVSAAATLGDLVESLLKRTVGVKDSGAIIPGHGGILDRIDSILLVVPASLVYIFFCYYYAV